MSWFGAILIALYSCHGGDLLRAVDRVAKRGTVSERKCPRSAVGSNWRILPTEGPEGLALDGIDACGRTFLVTALKRRLVANMLMGEVDSGEGSGEWDERSLEWIESDWTRAEGGGSDVGPHDFDFTQGRPV